MTIISIFRIEPMQEMLIVLMWEYQDHLFRNKCSDMVYLNDTGYKVRTGPEGWMGFMGEVISVEHICRHFKKNTVLEDISFTAEQGTQTAITGINGSGKSTLLRIISGCLRPDSGSILYFGKDMRHERGGFMDMCGYLPQEDPLIQDLSVKDNLSLWSGKRKFSDCELLKRLELDSILLSTVSSLSGGMKRRVSIACAVVNRPPLLIMDEPTASLDTYYCDSIHEFIRAYRRGGGTVIISTHDAKEAEGSDSCFVIENGRLKKE